MLIVLFIAHFFCLSMWKAIQKCILTTFIKTARKKSIEMFWHSAIIMLSVLTKQKRQAIVLWSKNVMGKSINYDFEKQFPFAPKRAWNPCIHKHITPQIFTRPFAYFGNSSENTIFALEMALNQISLMSDENSCNLFKLEFPCDSFWSQ